MNRPILIVGLPRSGTTWVAKVLSAAKGTYSIHEPDNEKTKTGAWLSKKELHRFPYLTPQDYADDYQKLWKAVFHGNTNRFHFNRLLRLFFKIFCPKLSLELDIGERSGFQYTEERDRGNTPFRVGEHPLAAWLAKQTFSQTTSRHHKKRFIVKSVHAPLCLEWITNRFNVDIVIVLRNPFALYASYIRMKMPDQYRNILHQEALQRDMRQYISNFQLSEQSWGDRVALQIALMYNILKIQIKRNPGWVVLSHDRLCVKPEASFQDLVSTLSLPWTEHIKKKLNNLNRHDSGFKPFRIARLQPDKWQEELSKAEQDIVEKWINRFDLQLFIRDYIATV